MKSPQEFRIDVYEKQDRALAARKRRRKYALLCLPLAMITAAAAIFMGPRLFVRRGNAGGNQVARALQVGRPAPVEQVNLWEETEEQIGREFLDLTEEEIEEFYRVYQEISDSHSADPAFPAALNTFARDTTAVLSRKFGENDCYCPLSLYYALALAGQGAAGETQEEFLSLLGASDLSWLADQCGLFYSDLYEDSDRGSRTLANSLWLDGRCEFRDDYLSTAENKLFSSLFRADFTDPKTGGEMTKWISENTKGLLKPEFKYGEDYTDATMLALINTVYLKSRWSDEFMKENNETGDFTKADGSKTTVEYMRQSDKFGTAYAGEGFIRASRRLTVGGSMVFILPDEGVDPWELLSDPEKFEEMFYPLEEGESTECELHWRVPKFSIDSRFDLEDTFQELGLVTAADPMRADFSGMTGDMPLYLASAQQGVRAVIDEEGVEAAAYTELMMEAGAAMPEERPVVEMNLNRPFLFAITGNTTSVGGENAVSILFVGVCGNPAA